MARKPDVVLDTRAPAAPLLEVVGLTRRFIGVTALDGVDLRIARGAVVSLIGPNGSGKTTLFNCVTGFLRPDSGSVRFRGDELVGQRPDRIALRGLARTFQNVRTFHGLSVLDNLLVAAQQYQEDSLWRRALHTRRIRELERALVERAEALLELVELAHLRALPAQHLAYGQRKMLEFASVLMPDPDLVMLDEPAAGVSTAIIERMKRYITDLNARGTTFLIVEHNMGMVMDISHRVVVLDHGQKIGEGTPREIQTDARVQEAYFGS